MKLYVDLDGTLLDSSLDNAFMEKVLTMGKEGAVEWYENVYVDDLKINMELIQTLVKYKNEGHSLVVFTNRGENQKEMSMKNLGAWANLFVEFQFHDGKKGNVKLDGVLYDNDEKYESCVEIGNFKKITF